MIVEKQQDNLEYRQATVKRTLSVEIAGRVSGLTGLTVEVNDFAAPVGAQCEIITRDGINIPAEVIGFRNRESILMPLAIMDGIASGDCVRCHSAGASVPVGVHLLGRVINAAGEPIDGKGPLLCQTRRAINTAPIKALQRPRIDSCLSTGIRAIDALTTCGRGQRMGIFSGPGVGKSILLGMIGRYTCADVNVIGLIGERGREVREFIEKDLGPDGLAHSVVVVSTSDEPGPLRVRAGFVVTTIAEYFRDLNKDVLVLMDSITRIAMAQRQIGLAMDEPPASKGFTPSVFALLPQLIERSGRNQNGSITGFYTVLVEGDDLSEPISDAMRGILDGHLWLSRSLANRGHYPAIDVLESISRLMVDIVDEEHMQMAREINMLTAVYRDIEDLVNIGAYAAGTNEQFDLAIQSQPGISQFLQQEINEGVSLEQSKEDLRNLIKSIGQTMTKTSETNQKNDSPAKSQGQGVSLGLERMMAGL